MRIKAPQPNARSFPAVNCALTRPDEKHVVGPLHALDLVHGNLRVAHAALQQQGRAADHAVHQEVVLDEVEHFIRHLQRRMDAHAPGLVGHTLSENERTDKSTRMVKISEWRNQLC